jgi:hypothetical protein
MTESLQETLEYLMAEGLVEKVGGRYRLTAKGHALSDIHTDPDVMPLAKSAFARIPSA